MMDGGVLELMKARRELDKAHKAACAAMARFQTVKAADIMMADERIAARSLLDQTVPLCKAILCAMQAVPEVALPWVSGHKKIRPFPDNSNNCIFKADLKRIKPPCPRTAKSLLDEFRKKKQPGVVATSARNGRPILVAMCLLIALFPMVGKADAVGDVAWTLWAEARGEGFQGLEAVATVIVNRASERGLSPEQVIRQPKQFSCWNSRQSAGTGHGKVWFQCLELSRRICDGSFQPLENWNHYFNPRLCSPCWASALRNTSRINQHVFGTI